MRPDSERLTVIGGGLAGVEAAWQAAARGVNVDLYEMRPLRTTPAHFTDRLAELVCSNSLGSDLPDRAPGLLKAELRRLGSLILACADAARVPAGGALAVDREGFAERITAAIEGHPRIRLIRSEVTAIPDGPAVIASGPLTSPPLAQAIARLTGAEHLYFYDAMAPIVYVDSVNFDVAFRASRYDRGSEEGGDYINCPLSRDEYERFVDALLSAERIALRDFERDIAAGRVSAGACGLEPDRFFEGCLPVEVLAARGREALAFGPMRPVGLTDPRTGRRPHAVVQLRRDNLAGTLYNLVGFQTNLKWPEQKRVFRLIPGLQQAEFARYGQMHRNTFVNAPVLLRPTLQFRGRDDLLFAGQITGVEGYVGNAGTGLVAGLNAARIMQGREPLCLPQETMLGALCHYVTHAEPAGFQPMKANFGLLPALDRPPRAKRERYATYSERALNALERLLGEMEAEGERGTVFA
jgi:methylenetetrahydrofolate--tRNA-(uracil-5-)-methyltransferase